MNKFEENFRSNLLSFPESELKFQLNELMGKDIDYICFVEGPTDPDFYSQINNTSLSNKKIRFIRSLTTDESGEADEIGKEGVLKKYYKMFEYPNYKEILNKCIFIVDHDYEGLVSEKYDSDYINKEAFSVTPYYSFENFFLTDINIKKIFEHFNIDENSYNDFMDYLTTFIFENSEYSRLKSSVTIACKKGKYNTKLPSSVVKVPYGKFAGNEMTPYHIFNFIFDNPKYHFFNKKFMDIKNDKMKESVYSNYLIKSYYLNETNKFINNRDYIRGHDIYKLLEQYLYQKHKINIKQLDYNNKTSRYNEIVKILTVDMEFFNGLGHKIL